MKPIKLSAMRENANSMICLEVALEILLADLVEEIHFEEQVQDDFEALKISFPNFEEEGETLE